jgi:hypothetical protein
MDKLKAVLAERPGLGQIHLCECDSIHLSIGPVTVNLAPEAFAQMATMVHRAMEELADLLRFTGEEGEPLKSFETQRSRVTH